MIIDLKQIATEYSISIEVVRNFFNELVGYSWLFDKAEINEYIFEFQAKDNQTYKEILTSGCYGVDPIDPLLLPYLLANEVDINIPIYKALEKLNIQMIEAVIAIDFSKNYISTDYIEEISIIGQNMDDQKLIDFATKHGVEPIRFKDNSLSLAEKIKIHKEAKDKLYVSVIGASNTANQDIQALKNILENNYILSQRGLSMLISIAYSNYDLYRDLIEISLNDIKFLSDANAQSLLYLGKNNGNKKFIEKALEYTKDFSTEAIPSISYPNYSDNLICEEGLAPSVAFQDFSTEAISSFSYLNYIDNLIGKEGFDPNYALNLLYATPAINDEESSVKLKLLEKILKYKPSLEKYNWYYTNLEELELLIKHYSLNKILETIISLDSSDIADYIINKLKITKERLIEIQKQFIKELFAMDDGSIDKFSLLNKALLQLNSDIFEYLLQQLTPTEKATYTPSAVDYVGALVEHKIIELKDKLTSKMICQDGAITDYLRAIGINLNTVELVVKFNTLVKNYIDTVKNGKNLLSQEIIDILEGKIELADLAKIPAEENGTDFTIAELVLISGKFALFEQILEANQYKDLSDKIINILVIFDGMNKNSEDKKRLLKKVVEKVDIDMDLDNGERLTDILGKNDLLDEKILEITKDPLFALLKKDADLMAPSKESKFIHIAISNGEGFWSTGAWSLARLISKKYPEVKFHLIDKKMIEEGGDKFMEQFDGFINPGGDDSYPRDLSEFSKINCIFELEMEQTYQLVLEKTKKFDLPLLSMCAGAQHLVLHSEGSLKPLKGYCGEEKHTMNFIKGTLAHIFSLTKEQQKKFFEDLELPEINYPGDTAHLYAAVNEKLGKNIELGAVSEEGVPMAYVTKDGLARATQFHPEHYYNSNENNAIHQIAWIDNFIKFAKMVHKDKLDGGIRVEEHIKLVQDCLYAYNAAEHLFDEVEIIG